MNMNTELESLVKFKTVARSMTLWLVDDDDEYRESLAGQLRCELEIHSLRQFSSAELAAAALVKGPPPDLILLDIHTGGMSALEALGPMKEIAPSTRVLVMTTVRDFDVEIAVFAAGADGFISKLIPFEGILDWVRNSRRTPPASGRISRPWIESSEEDAAQPTSILQRLLRFVQTAPRS